jgi:hypothetical protein
MGRAEQGKNIPRGGEGAHKLMRCSNKVKKILLKKPMKSSVLPRNLGREEPLSPHCRSGNLASPGLALTMRRFATLPSSELTPT